MGESMMDSEIYRYLEKSAESYGKNKNENPRYFDFPYPQRLTILTDILKLHILRELGDIKEYLRIQKQIIDLSPEAIKKHDRALYEVIGWVDSQMDAMMPVTAEKDVLVMTMAVWGEEYRQRMLDYTFCSLLAEGNFPTLVKEKTVVLHIQTTECDKIAIEESGAMGRIKALGVHVEYLIIPEELTKSNLEVTYWLLGAAATLGLHFAKIMGASYHHSYPDVIYSNKFFAELLRINRKAIFAPGMRSQEAQMKPILEGYRKGEVLSIPANDFVAHHLNNIHLVSWAHLVNNRQESWTYPNGHVIMWETDNSLQFNSPHQNILWLDYSLIKDTPKRFYMTLDSELDFLIKDNDFYVPKEDDELYMAEISATDRADMSDDYSDPLNTAKTFWGRIKHRDVLKFFLKTAKFVINRDIRPAPKNVMSAELAKAERNYLFNTLVIADPYQYVKTDRYHIGRVYK